MYRQVRIPPHTLTAHPLTRFPLYGYRSQGGVEPSIASDTLDSCNGHTHAIDLPEDEGGTVSERECGEESVYVCE